MAFSIPKEEVSASTPDSPGAPAESLVERQTARETGRVNDQVHTSQTTATQAAQDRRRRDPQGTMPSHGPQRVQRGASAAPQRGQASGRHQEPVLCRPPGALRSGPVNLAASAPGRRRHHGNRRANGRIESDRTGGGAAHQRRATRHASEARRRPRPRHRTRCQAITAAWCRKPGGHAEHRTARDTNQGESSHTNTHSEQPGHNKGGGRAKPALQHTHQQP